MLKAREQLIPAQDHRRTGTGRHRLGARIYSKTIELGWNWMDRECLMQCLAENERHDGALGGGQGFSTEVKTREVKG